MKTEQHRGGVAPFFAGAILNVKTYKKVEYFFEKCYKI